MSFVSAVGPKNKSQVKSVNTDLLLIYISQVT